MTSKPEKALAKQTPAEIFLEPSCDQLLVATCCRGVVADDEKDRDCFAIFYGFFTVTPSTNSTVLSMFYQAYLNIIFHRSNVAFYTHATTMPLVNMFWLAWAANAKFSNDDEWIDLSLFLCICFFVWYLVWGFVSGLWWFGFTSLPILTVCYLGAHFYWKNHYNDLHPMWLSALMAFIQSLSHYPEDLPPRVGGIQAWSKKRDFFFREVDTCCDMVGRLIRLSSTALIFGPFDEWVASPRLMPLFWSLWPMHKLMGWCGCFPEHKAKIDAVFKKAHDALKPQYRVEFAMDPQTHQIVKKPLPSSNMECCWGISDKCAGAIACDEVLRDEQGREMIANPALDYLGTGGSAYLMVKDNISCTDVICGRYNLQTDVQLNVLAGVRQACRVVTEDGFAIGVSATPAPTEMGATSASSSSSSPVVNANTASAAASGGYGNSSSAGRGNGSTTSASVLVAQNQQQPHQNPYSVPQMQPQQLQQPASPGYHNNSAPLLQQQPQPQQQYHDEL